MRPRRGRVPAAAQLLVEHDLSGVLDDCRGEDGVFDLARLIPAVQSRLPPLTEDELLRACEIAIELLKADRAYARRP